MQGSPTAGWAEGGRTVSLRTGTEATWEDGGGNSRAPCPPLGYSASHRALRCGVSGGKVLQGRGVGGLGPAAQAASGECALLTGWLTTHLRPGEHAASRAGCRKGTKPGFGL